MDRRQNKEVLNLFHTPGRELELARLSLMILLRALFLGVHLLADGGLSSCVRF